MDVEAKLKLIAAPPTEEIITEEELRQLLETKKKPVVYCGYEVSGPVHIAALSGIKKLIDFQKAGFLVKILLADYHTWLNRKGDLEWIEKMATYYRHCITAAGADMKKTEFVLGSTFQLNKEYMNDVLKMSLLTSIPRARRSMTLIGRDLEHAKVSQILYPLMQAEDIKALQVDVAFGDSAQRKIHMLAREVLPRIGHKRPIAVHHSLILGLTGKGKMSSSMPETMIKIHDPPAVIKEKIGKAFCPAGVIDDNPIMQLCKLLIFPWLSKSFQVKRSAKYGGLIEFASYAELESSFRKGALHPQDLKSAVADELIKILKPVRIYFRKNKEARKGLEVVSKIAVKY
jgi:tyrosyl-tRNA synthetase